MTLEYAKPPTAVHPNILLYGPGKVGKTKLACSGPEGVLLLNCDTPEATTFAHDSYPDGRIMEVKVPPYQKGRGDRMLSIMSEISRMVAEDQNVVGTVAIDPVDELYRLLLEDLSARAISPEIQVYGAANKHVERFCRFLCECPVTVVLVCHEMQEKDEQTGEVMRIPFSSTKSGSSAFSATLEAMVSIVAYAGVWELEDGEVQYGVQLRHGKGRHGGDRFNCLGPSRTDEISDWVKVIEAHRASLRKGGSKPQRTNSKPELSEKRAEMANV